MNSLELLTLGRTSELVPLPWYKGEGAWGAVRGWWDLPIGFSSEINFIDLISLSLLYKIKPFLLVMMSMTSYDVQWRHLNRHLGSAILDYFLKSQEITEIIHEFVQFYEENWKKKSWFLAGPTWDLMAAITSSKMMDTQLTCQNFRREWRNSFWKFKLLTVTCIFKTLKKAYGGGIYNPSPLVRPRVKVCFWK